MLDCRPSREVSGLPVYPSVLHVTHEDHPLTIGEGEVVGHSAVVCGCTMEAG